MQVRSFHPGPHVQLAAAPPRSPRTEDLFAPQPPEPPPRERMNIGGAVGLSAFIAASAAAGGAAGVGAMVWSGWPGLAAGAAMGGLGGVTAGWLATKGALYGLTKVTGREPSDQLKKWAHRLTFAACLAGGAAAGYAAIPANGGSGFWMVASMVCGVAGGLCWGQELIFGNVFDDNQLVGYRNREAQRQFEQQTREYEEELARFRAELVPPGQEVSLEENDESLVVGDVTLPRQTS
ncbi:MAG: hypothetical protein AB7S38_34195 [Vulcanimicrobiota bacterium]